MEAVTADLHRRFSALERLYGKEGASRIRSATVAVVGIGGVGSWSAETLARSGVARLVLVDLDHVAESNINRQVHALSATIGQSKVQAMRERIAGINPCCRVDAIEEFVEPGNWPMLLPCSVDAVIDACDQMRAKVAIAAHAMQQGYHFIMVGAAGGKRLAHKVDIDDLSKVTHDPLLAQLRYRLRKHHGAAKDGRRIGTMCVYSKEAVATPVDTHCDAENDGTLNCHGYGSLASVTATFGHCAAGWILERISSK